jgi:hypothetical protein
VRVIRWVVPVDDEHHEFPLNGAILHVDCRAPHAVTMWTLDTGGPTMPRTFRVFGTGHDVPGSARFIGTALSPDMPPFSPRGALVWHLFEVPS